MRMQPPATTQALPSATIDRRIKRSRSIGLLLLPLAGVWAFVPGVSAFSQMCGIAISLYLLIKLHTLFDYRATYDKPPFTYTVAWFLAWPGLNPRQFFHETAVDPPSARAWRFAALKTILGACLLFLVAPLALPAGELLAGWIALVGTALLIHFGAFHALALYWRRRGRDVRPIMNAPIRAASVSEFWSKRWNLAFRDYAHAFVFAPLARRVSPRASIIAGYLFSGAVHELAISVPARAGFGLPTLYFALQALALLLERAAAKAGYRITGSIRGTVWTAIVTTLTAPVLFHPPFVRRVIVPFIESLPPII